MADSKKKVDPLEAIAEARRRPKQLRRLPGLITRSVRLVWSSGRGLFATSTAIQLINGLLLAVQVLLVGLVLDAILMVQEGTESWDAVILPVAGLALAMGLTTVAAAVQGQFQRLLGELVIRSTWVSVLEVSTSVPLIEYEEPDFYDRLQRVQSNAVAQPFVMTQGLIGIMGGVAGLVGLIASVLVLSPLVLPLLIVAGFPLYVGSRIVSRIEFNFIVGQVPRMRMRDYLRSLQVDRDPAKEVRAFGLTEALRTRFDNVYLDYIADLKQHIRKRTAISLSTNVISALVLAVTLLFLVWLVARGELDIAAAGAAIVAVRMIAGQLSGLFGGVQRIFESSLYLDDLEEYLAMKPSAVAADTTGDPAPRGFTTLQAEALSFSYPDSEHAAVRDASLTVNSGEIVALVGENGSGKTTLAKLLAGLYVPEAGTIRWDGVDVAEYSPSGLRESIALIFQDFTHYQLTAAENIGFGRVDDVGDMARIAQAAQQAGADGFLKDLPSGYETILSRMFKGGRDLSIGQWQRVAIARAFFRDAPFVILDEPTASLDPRAEHALFEALRELLAGRTVLFISHRLSTVRSADRIYVLDRGEIIEHGTHDELMTLGGRYAELFSLQAAGYLRSSAS
ncbi:MAG TPA: ABC transporter ATP-binding protein [Acidimicrobiia bacterium]|nr:ABC transporter ATP-binding protein [Acidimicrobiia bacterium]